MFIARSQTAIHRGTFAAGTVGPHPLPRHRRSTKGSIQAIGIRAFGTSIRNLIAATTAISQATPSCASTMASGSGNIRRRRRDHTDCRRTRGTGRGRTKTGVTNADRTDTSDGNPLDRGAVWPCQARLLSTTEDLPQVNEVVLLTAAITQATAYRLNCYPSPPGRTCAGSNAHRASSSVKEQSVETRSVDRSSFALRASAWTN